MHHSPYPQHAYRTHPETMSKPLTPREQALWRMRHKTPSRRRAVSGSGYKSPPRRRSAQPQGQDLWLTKYEARHYVTTRRWAHAVRAADADPDIDGLTYRPRHNEDTSPGSSPPAPPSHPTPT